MTLAVLDAPAASGGLGRNPPLRLAVLARLAVEDGASRGELAKELGFLSPGVAGRLAIDTELVALVRAGLVAESRARFRATDAGQDQLGKALGLKAPGKSWTELRDIRLVAKALGLEGEGAARIKGLKRPDQLRGEILARAYGFRLRGVATPAKIRASLALAALELTFGDSIKSGLTVRDGFNAKTGRVLAGQLLAKPRDMGTDSRLVATLAAEQVGAAKLDADALRAGLLRRFVVGGPPSADAPPAASRGGRCAPVDACG